MLKSLAVLWPCGIDQTDSFHLGEVACSLRRKSIVMNKWIWNILKQAKDLRSFCLFSLFHGAPPSQPSKLRKKHIRRRPACHSLLDFGCFTQVMAARLFVIFEAIFASFSVGGAQGGCVDPVDGNFTFEKTSTKQNCGALKLRSGDC